MHSKCKKNDEGTVITVTPTNAAEKRRAVRNPKTGRKKTSIACQHCWKSKTRCGIKRPCDRCVRLGHQDCHDRPEATRKRQHINKTKSAENKNKSYRSSSGSASGSTSGYMANSENNVLPPIIFNNNNNNMLMLPPPITMAACSSSDTTIATITTNIFPPVLDPNFGANITYKNQRENDPKKQRKKKKTKKSKHKKRARYVDDEPPLKRRRISRTKNTIYDNGHDADNDYTDNEQIIYWDQPHKEIDPFSDSSHYSTEYSEDDDPSLAVIISIRDDDEFKKEERKAKDTLCSAPSPQNVNKNVYQDLIKEEHSIDADLAAIIAPVGMQKQSQHRALFKMIPSNHRLFNYNQFQQPYDVLSQTIPNLTIPKLPQMTHISSIPSSVSSSVGPYSHIVAHNGFRPFVMNRYNALSVFPNGSSLSKHFAIAAHAPIARITSLIPAPPTNMSIN